MPDVIVIIAAIFVGLSFIAAGGTKLASHAQWLEHAKGLCVPVIVARVVPWVELVIGAALVAQLWRRWFAVAAIIMLLAFTALLGYNLRKGRRQSCACFGVFSDKPIGTANLVRNVVFLAAAAVATL